MKGKNKRYPDVFFLNFGDKGVCIEVGDYTPSKWFDFPVVHIGFNGTITKIRCEDSSFAQVVYETTNEIFKENKSLGNISNCNM